MLTTKSVSSEAYLQLGTIFKDLETAAFVEGIDFGENLTACYEWFVSPQAAIYLEKRFPEHWASLQNNSRFFCTPVPWQRHKGLAYEIKLKL